MSDQETSAWNEDGAGGAETEIVPNIHSFDTMQAWAVEGPEVLDYPPTGAAPVFNDEALEGMPNTDSN